MNRNSKIFTGLAIFLFCCAFSFKFTVGNGSSFQFMWVDMISLMMGLIAASAVMILLMHKARKEEYLDDDELELKEFSPRTRRKFDSDEFV